MNRYSHAPGSDALRRLPAALRRPASGLLRFGIATALLAAAGCGKSGDVTGGPKVDYDADTTAFVAPDPALPTDTLRLASLNMSIGFPVAQLLFLRMDEPAVAYDAIQEMYGQFKSGYPAERVKAMAREIVAEDPDVVGLQEVMTIWESGVLVNDFLAELVRAVDSLGGPAYAAVGTVLNDTVLTGRKGDSSITVRFREGNAFLVKPGFDILDSAREMYYNLLPLDTLGTVTERAVDLLKLRSPRGVVFQAFNTHLEVITSYRKSQASELVIFADSVQERSQRAGASRGRLQVVLGDLNSAPGTEGHKALLDVGFADTFDASVAEDEGFTCCVENAELSDTTATFSNRRIDYVLARGLVGRVLSRTRVKGAFTAADGKSFLASDHRMVVAHIVAQ